MPDVYLFGKTIHPLVFAGGDAMAITHFVAGALATGGMAGVGVNQSLAMEEWGRRLDAAGVKKEEASHGIGAMLKSVLVPGKTRAEEVKTSG